MKAILIDPAAQMATVVELTPDKDGNYNLAIAQAIGCSWFEPHRTFANGDHLYIQEDRLITAGLLAFITAQIEPAFG